MHSFCIDWDDLSKTGMTSASLSVVRPGGSVLQPCGLSKTYPFSGNFGGTENNCKVINVGSRVDD